MSCCDTKIRILDCAEQMFANHGYTNTSMRSLAQQAGVNLASANYHFGTKDNLLRAVIERRIIPLNKIRQKRIDEVMVRAQQENTLPETADLIKAFFEPTLEFRNSCTGAKAFIGLVSRSISEPDKTVRSCFLEFVKPSVNHKFEMLRLALPHIPAEILKARLMLSVGTMSYALSMNISEQLTAQDMSATGTNQLLLQQLHTYVLAGLEAPI